jgi:nucleotide-binding universal stress UspA family protein
MARFSKILCPIDFSDFSTKAYAYAESLARHYQADLIVLHVMQGLTTVYPYYGFAEAYGAMEAGLTELRENASRELAGFLKEHAHERVKYEQVMLEGGVTDSILSLAGEKKADLIVMGTHGRHGLDHALIGSVTEKVLRKALCPVLVVMKTTHDFVAPDAPDADPVHLQRILHGTDFSENSARALQFALSLAMEYNAELTLLHVLDGLPEGKSLEEETQRLIAAMTHDLPEDAKDWCTLKTIVRVGRPYQEIIQLGLESGADLITLGVRGRNALDLAIFGSTTHRVIQRGSCPVLAVHT